VTLLELLMYMLLAAGLTAVVSQTLINGIRSDSRLELHQRALALWSRISFLIDADVAEGNEIQTKAPLVGCKNDTVNPVTLFTVMVPVQVEAQDANPRLLRTVMIQYYMNDGNLMRCGPPFNADGSLQVSAVATNADFTPAMVGRRVFLEVIDRPTPNSIAEQSRSIHYHLNITTPDGEMILPGERSTTARTRVAVVTP
jgi:hypothetical protein